MNTKVFFKQFYLTG